jgi:hypothetical protein
MSLFSFDEKGNLFPYEIIKCNDIHLLSEYFVSSFKNSKTREKIFTGFLQYILDIHKLIGSGWTIWIGGSFITNKKDPDDIDIVNIFNWTKEINNQSHLFGENFFSDNSKRKYYVDGYFIALYPENSEKYLYNTQDIEHWKDFFSHTREDIIGYRHPKGIIEVNIIFDDDINGVLNKN